MQKNTKIKTLTPSRHFIEKNENKNSTFFIYIFVREIIYKAINLAEKLRRSHGKQKCTKKQQKYQKTTNISRNINLTGQQSKTLNI